MPDTPASDAAAGLTDEARLAVNALTRHAENLLNLGQMLDQAAQSMGWHCSKATRYRDSVAMHRVDARRIAAELQSLAKEIEDGARRVNPDVEINLRLPGVERAQQQMDDWMRKHRPGARP
ncbi:MAG: hypothetical protein FJW81_10335 [Actinobacteria bacterium]|nr:hypothetical protein [Actinomycetota bacterium]